MAGDLWESAVNNHPQQLAGLKGKTKRIIKKTGTSLERSDREPGEGKSHKSILETLRTSIPKWTGDF
jgi:hypothetical protein